MNNMTLALRIREMREQSGKSQEQVSQALGISRQAYIRLEQGKRTISFLDIKKISEFLGIDYKKITDVSVNNDLSLMSLCRDEEMSPQSEEAFKTIDHILGVFSAQEKLFYRFKEKEDQC